MLINVDVFGEQATSRLALPIGGGSDPIQIKDVEGLGPVKANINSDLYGVVPGEAITGTSVGKRNIVLTLGLNPDWKDRTIEELRKLLYRYFMPQAPVTLDFATTHLPLCQIDGVVESLEPNIFSKDPEIQVSIICPRPDFVAVTATTVEGVVGDDAVYIDYDGSVPTGMNVRIDPSSARGAFTGRIYIYGDASQALLTLDDVTIDDVNRIEINSVPGAKYIRTFDNPPVNLLGKVLSPYTWPLLRPGSNRLRVSATLHGQLWTLSYSSRFGGI